MMLGSLGGARIWLVLSGWAALAATFLPSSVLLLRIPVTVAFLLICPGAACLRTLHPRLEAAMCAVALSVAIDTVVAEGLYFGRAFTVPRAVVALAVLTSLIALRPVRRRAA